MPTIREPGLAELDGEESGFLPRSQYSVWVFQALNPLETQRVLPDASPTSTLGLILADFHCFLAVHLASIESPERVRRKKSICFDRSQQFDYMLDNALVLYFIPIAASLPEAPILLKR